MRKWVGCLLSVALTFSVAVMPAHARPTIEPLCQTDPSNPNCVGPYLTVYTGPQSCGGGEVCVSKSIGCGPENDGELRDDGQECGLQDGVWDWR